MKTVSIRAVPGLRLALAETAETARAPELRYLASWVRQEAEAVFGAVREVPVDEPLAPGDPDAPLLVLDSRTLVARRSLERMQSALAGGAPAAAPVPLAATGLAAERPVYTLRGFEALETIFLERGEPDEPASPDGDDGLPCLLLAPGAAAGRVPRDLLAPTAGAAAARAGLCHRFADYYGQAREDVVAPLVDGVESPSETFREVLEVGCGRGATGALLQERLGCRVTGVELNPEVARAAARVLHRVHAGDFLEVSAELLRAIDAGAPRFDALVALELFEHLTDQEGFLDRARRLVRPGGRIVLSVPNVGHYAVVEDLLAGRWDYLPIGLLCYTHYRFFTRRTLEDWLRRCGFGTFRLVAQETELPERFRGRVGGMETDQESLRTKGFFVVAENV